MNYKNLTDFRQIECFTACVRSGSISAAAAQLHMSQPSVSKAIRSMEDTLGVQLFERCARGTVLTPQGEAVYPYAKAILDNLREMRLAGEERQTETLRICANPSSWFADAFLDFYLAHREDGLHYQIYTAGTLEIAERLKRRTDDMGFAYVMKNQSSAFQYYLKRNYLEFFPLKETRLMLFSGKERMEEGRHFNRASGSDEPSDRGPFGRAADTDFGDNISRLRLIQRFPDEFSSDNYRELIDLYGNTVEKAETVVTTNSEYIMSRILRTGDLCNISADYLSVGHSSDIAGIPMEGLREDRIVFGLVRRHGENLSEKAEMFVEFIRRKLENRLDLMPDEADEKPASTILQKHSSVLRNHAKKE
ncbi:MAG: LysR family transcriptional regulator [Lachnospiraceae bacterium]|nr:LysR family transcriptional regulator [Lachnospiraceae bacterium]